MTPLFFRSHDFKKALGPCYQELRSLYFDTVRFRGTHSIKTTLKNNDDVIVSRSRKFGKIL